MGTILAAFFRGLFGGLFGAVFGWLGSFLASRTIFRRGEESVVSKADAASLDIVARERAADVNAPATGKAVSDRLRAGDA